MRADPWFLGVDLRICQGHDSELAWGGHSSAQEAQEFIHDGDMLFRALASVVVCP